MPLLQSRKEECSDDSFIGEYIKMSIVNLGDVVVYPTSKSVSTPQIAAGRALLIAISYQNSSNHLTGTYNDGLMVQSVIKTRGILDSNVVFMTDVGIDPSSAYFPTKENIERGIRWLCSNSSKSEIGRASCREIL